MNYSIIPTPQFEKDLKHLYKKYPLIKKDIAILEKLLSDNPTTGIPLKRGCYKIRIKITGKSSGKSGGARIITHVKVVNQRVYLMRMYDKSEMEDLAEGELEDLINNL
ncbi:MAG: type II toxin-antitoxin system RelE/ParE family toxin [Chitinophagales bacterium]